MLFEKNMEQIKSIILEILNQHPTTYNKIIIKNTKIMDVLKDCFTNEIPIKEQIFLLLNDFKQKPKCSCGNFTKFLSITAGYSKGCSPKCPDTTVNANKKRKKTLKELYGSSNLNEIETVNQKRIAAYQKKYGVDNPFKSTQIKEKIKKNNKLKYGFDNPIQSEIIKEKIAKTMTEKYGVDNYFKSNVAQEKNNIIKLQKYGTVYPIQNVDVKEKRNKTNKSKYGGNAPLCSEKIKEKIKEKSFINYGVDHYTKKHISSNNLEILNNRNLLLELINEDQNIIKTATNIGVNITTVYNYIKKHGISLNTDIKFNFKSIQEQEVSQFLDSICIDYVKNTRNIIGPYELDFFIPKQNLAIEMNGLYWHSDLFKAEDYHYTKFIKCKEKGIQLIQIWENEWNSNQNTVKNMLAHKLGKVKDKIYARNTIVKEISNKLALAFLDKHHIQGRTPKITISFGLYELEELVSVMTFQKIQDGYDLTRFSASKAIPGGFSKLLKHFIRLYNPATIISFSDNRWSLGNVYQKNGFDLHKNIPYTYYYTDYKNFYHRFNFRKNLIKHRYNIDIDGKTEKELVKELGFERIWDAGKIKWVWQKK